jgi:hypothetical protein
MSLRRSPERTLALLAANRANGRKFNGPRDLSRQQRDLLKGLRDGGRLARSLEILARAPLRQQLDFARLYASLHKAVAPELSEEDLVLAAAAFVWRVKRRMEHRVRSPRFKAQVAARDGRLPPPWRMPLQRPGGQVTVTVWVRPGRPAVPDGQASDVGQPKNPRIQNNRQGKGREKGRGWSQSGPRWDQQSPLYVGFTIRRNGQRPWQPSDGPRSFAAACTDPFLLSGGDVAPGRNDALPSGIATVIDRSDGTPQECNRNSSDKVTVPFVKCDKIALQAGMSKFLNSVRSYVRGLTGKTEDVE